MRNVDKYKDELIKMANKHSYVYVSNEKVEGCGGSEQFIKFIRNEASKGFIEWLYKDYNFELSKVEYELLRYLYKKGFSYIARDEYNYVHAYDSHPSKIDCYWRTTDDDHADIINLYKLSCLFQFLKWSDEEPTSIEELLENCEVKDDD